LGDGTTSPKAVQLTAAQILRRFAPQDDLWGSLRPQDCSLPHSWHSSNLFFVDDGSGREYDVHAAR